MRMRLGVSLVELIVTLTACSAILTTSAALMHRAMHAHSKARSFLDGERSARRLAQSFRHDAHDALSMETQDSSAGTSAESELVARFEMHDGESVEYRQSGGRVERTWQVAEKISARDVYAFSAATSVAAVMESPGVVSLSIDPAASLSSMPTILRVEAALGRNARFAQSNDDAHNNAEPAP